VSDEPATEVVEDKRLVIDSTIMQAAGSTETTRSRALLEAVRASSHSLVASEALYREWSEHLTPFSMTWLVEMIKRRRVDSIGEVHEEALRAQLARCYPDEQHRVKPMLKDVHLLEAALGRGMRVLALDEKVRAHFRGVVDAVPQIGRVLWANPDIEREGVIPWVEAGVPREAVRQLDPNA